MTDDGLTKRQKHALTLLKNMESVAVNDREKKHDIANGRRLAWDDRYIDIIPDEDRRGICIYFYRQELRTAQVGLSIKAAFVLMGGLKDLLFGDSRFLKALQEVDDKKE